MLIYYIVHVQIEAEIAREIEREGWAEPAPHPFDLTRDDGVHTHRCARPALFRSEVSYHATTCRIVVR